MSTIKHSAASIAILSEHRLLQAQIIATLPRYFPTLQLATSGSADVIIDLDAMPGRLRLGRILDQITAALQPTMRQMTACGPYILAVADCLLYRDPDDDRAPIRLTEKERDILVRLQAATGGWVSRETLLAELWGYGPGIETHTLETHIYRLRQKFEADPAAPEWLLSTEAGYCLVTSHTGR